MVSGGYLNRKVTARSNNVACMNRPSDAVRSFRITLWTMILDCRVVLMVVLHACRSTINGKCNAYVQACRETFETERIIAFLKCKFVFLFFIIEYIYSGFIQEYLNI